MSGSIFGDDDDFELVAGSDTPSAGRTKPAPEPAPRPVAPRNPATSVPTAAGNQNKTTRPAQPSSSLPRPTLPTPTRTPAPENRTRRTLPTSRTGTDRPTAPTQERALPVPTRTPAPAPTRDTTETNPSTPAPTPRAETPVAPPSPEPAPSRDHYADELPINPVPRPAPDYETAAPATTRRGLREEREDRYDPADDYRAPVPTREHEGTQGTPYSRPPYTEEYDAPSANRAQATQPTAPRRAEPVEQVRQPEPPAPKGKGKNARPAKGKKEKPAAKGPGNFSGGRNGVLVVRIFAIALVAALMLAGAKSIFFPPQIPDPTTVTNVVKKRLGVTNFPTENGKAFVTSFAKIYFTVDPTASNKNDLYTPYMNSSLSSNMPLGSGNDTKQTVSEGPIVSGVKAVDDNNATYTVAARLNNATNWVYIDVPVYYDSSKAGFAISGMPAFTPAPTKIDAPPADAPFEQDTQLANDIQKSVMEQFFPAWAASNTPSINLVVLKEANTEAKTGLGGAVKFSSIQSFTVEKKQEGDPSETTRKAQATIVWASPTDAKLTYTQKYNMVIFRQPDNRWYIKELTSGIRS